MFLLAAACGPSTSSSVRDGNETAGAAGTTGEEPGTGGSHQAGQSGQGGNSGRAGSASPAGGSNIAGDTNRAGSPNAAGSSSDAGTSNPSGGSGGRAGQPDVPEPNCEERVAPTSQLRRLTHEHYDRTVRDLLGVTQVGEGGPPSALLAKASPEATLSELESEAYRVAAKAIAEVVMADSTRRARFLACTPSDAEDACWHDTIVWFGRRAFRRPLSAQEVTRFEQLVTTAAAEAESLSVAELGQLLLAELLVSPSFIFRAELAGTPDAQGNFALSSHEIATRLSYLLWGSLPDEVLDSAADAGALTTKEQIRAEAERMLADDRARDQLASFHRSYRKWPLWPAADHDEALFPLFHPGVSAVMFEELERFFDAVTFEGRGTFQDLLWSTRGFVNADTAPIYGLDAREFGSELEEVSLDPAKRPGFLTRVGFLASFSAYAATSPIRRGVFVIDSVLGITPPPDSSTSPSVPLPGTYLTQREATEALTSPVGCRECHQTYIDPPGFVLEAYDAIGAWQTHERGTGAPIDTVADVLIDGAPVTVTDPADLMQRIAHSRDAQRTFAESWLSYAYERAVSPLDTCTIDHLHYRIAQGNYAILELVRDLTQTDAFRLRASASGTTP